MPIDLNTVLEAADLSRGYERELLASLVSRRSVRAEASDIHELCAEEVQKLEWRWSWLFPEWRSWSAMSSGVRPFRPPPSREGR